MAMVQAGGLHVLWSGTITFGLVSVPVAMIPATRGRRSPLRLLHRSDHSLLQRRMICPKHKTYVHPEHIVRGYEVEQEKYVVVQDSEIQAIEPRRSKDIEIKAFVDRSSIDPVYFERAYYLVPTSAEKPCQLLTETLENLDVVGIGEFVMYDREHLVGVMSIEGALSLAMLRYQQEVRSPEDIEINGHSQAKAAGQIAAEIRKLSRRFDPREIRDAYQERIDKLIERKKRQHQVVEVPQAAQEEGATEEEGQGADLIAVLEQSLAKARKEAS